MSYFLIFSNDKRVNNTLHSWWRDDKKSRSFHTEERIEKHRGTVFIYSSTPYVVDVLRYTKGNEKEKLRVFEVRELSMQEI